MNEKVKGHFHWKALFFFYGPATVDNALHGGSTEAREQWKRHWAERKRLAAEERAARRS
ncbi:hypothetical protein GCM10009557_27570 [Virgisporangium ochraceum]|uniref:Uncharacterized protein n=1 Tax=Virgisporangium ochraceum TaxID=65505 RepID=A0A8J4A7G7_9ACTN|nr:hypothetical protein [Virgisporangium ochraceum]GIJ74271.1 hypothetical protein Voc01_091880 [Virgisporangium ochraceum]